MTATAAIAMSYRSIFSMRPIKSLYQRNSCRYMSYNLNPASTSWGGNKNTDRQSNAATGGVFGELETLAGTANAHDAQVIRIVSTAAKVICERSFLGPLVSTIALRQVLRNAGIFANACVGMAGFECYLQPGTDPLGNAVPHAWLEVNEIACDINVSPTFPCLELARKLGFDTRCNKDMQRFIDKMNDEHEDGPKLIEPLIQHDRSFPLMGGIIVLGKYYTEPSYEYFEDDPLHVLVPPILKFANPSIKRAFAKVTEKELEHASKFPQILSGDPEIDNPLTLFHMNYVLNIGTEDFLEKMPTEIKENIYDRIIQRCKDL